MSKFVYEVLDNGVFLCKGTSKEISDVLNINQTMVYQYADKKQYLKRYTINTLGHYEKEMFVKTMTPHEEKLEWMYRHLLYDGNTFCWTKGDEFKKELNKRGIYFKPRPATDGKGFILVRYEKQRKVQPCRTSVQDQQ